MTDELSKETTDQIALENTMHGNRLKLIVITSICICVVLFVIGLVLNFIQHGAPLEGGVVSTTVMPLIELFKIMSGM